MNKKYYLKTWLVLVVGILITFVVALYTKLEIDKVDESDFTYECNKIVNRIEARLYLHALLLRSGVAFYDASDSVNRIEWHNFVGQYNLDTYFPGILGLGFSLKIPKENLIDHINKVRNEGFPDYTVWPENERETYTSIIYLEPFSDKNRRAFGYDMMSEPTRRDAMERARDMNIASISGKVVLVQESGTDPQTAYLMYVPVYKKGAEISTVEQRRKAILGWVYSPYRMNDLISTILKNRELEENSKKYYLHIYDGAEKSPESLMFETYYSGENQTPKESRFNLDYNVDFNGHQWTISFTYKKYNVFIDYQSAWGVLFGGIIISFLLFLLIQTPVKTQINAQKIAEDLTAELKESTNRLRTIITVTPVPLALTKMEDGVIVLANNAISKLLKMSVSEITGQKLVDFYNNKMDRAALLKTIQTGESVENSEILLKKSDGELFWSSVSLTALEIDNEQILITAVNDISERKKAEEEIIRHKDNLEEMVAERTKELTISEQKLLRSIKDISDYKQALDESSSVAITDSRGIIKYANDKFCKMSKYSREEILGHTHNIVNSGLHSKEFFKEFWGTISKGNVWRGEIRNRAKDGSYYWLDTTVIPFIGKNGRPYQYVGVRFDITSRKETEAALIKAKEAADSASRAKSDFLANMSHEIRTPMNAIIGFSELLSRSVKDKKQLVQVESIHSSGKSLLKIINDILDLSKIEAGKIEIKPVPINLCNFLREMETMFAQIVKEKNIELKIDYKEACNRTLLIDEVRLRQIAFNLIGNAVKFTDDGFVSLHIESKENSENNKNVDLTILVQDTGIGIPPKLQDEIFKAFYQQPNQSDVKYGGTGLGLPITKRLVRKMGGTISVESEVGKGSTFKIELPNIPVLDTDVDAKPKIFDASLLSFMPATILIADDDEGNRSLIVDILEKWPLKTIQAMNGEETVKLALEHTPDLILMDLRMPIMDGYEATKMLRENKLTSSIPVIAISATATAYSTLEKQNENKIFDDCLLKPLDIENFIDKLKDYLKYEVIGSNQKLDAFNLEEPNYKMSNDIKHEIPMFIKTLEQEFIPEYNKIVKNQVINEIETFASDLLAISQKYNCKMMIDYSNVLNEFAEFFDFEKLIFTLKKFPNLIDWLKAEINTK